MVATEGCWVVATAGGPEVAARAERLATKAAMVRTGLHADCEGLAYLPDREREQMLGDSPMLAVLNDSCHNGGMLPGQPSRLNVICQNC